MKQIFLVLIVLVVTQLKSLAQTTPEEKVFKEVNPPNFLVHNQLSPEIFKLEYAGGLAKGTFKSTEGVETNGFSQNTLTVSGYPLTLINKRQQQLYLGFGYVQDKYTSFNTEPSPPVFQSTFQSVYLNVFLNTRIKNKFYWFLYVQGGVNGTHPFDEAANSFNEIILNKINYKANRNMNIGVGVAYISNLGKPLILPSVAFVYSQPHYLINIDFPVKAEVEGIFARGKWRPVGGLSFPASAYYVKDIDQYFSTQGLTGYLGMRYRVFDLLYLYAAYQSSLGETFEAGSRSERKEIGTYTGQSRFVISMNVQIARFIPIYKN